MQFSIWANGSMEWSSGLEPWGGSSKPAYIPKEGGKRKWQKNKNKKEIYRSANFQLQLLECPYFSKYWFTSILYFNKRAAWYRENVLWTDCIMFICGPARGTHSDACLTWDLKASLWIRVKQKRMMVQWV